MKSTLPLLLLVLVPTWADAQTTSARAHPETADEARRLLREGDDAFARGDSAAAKEACRLLLTWEPDQSRAHYQLARMEPPGSVRQIGLLRRYTELEPQDAWGFLALGQAFEDTGEPDSAREVYAKAVALEPDSQEMKEALSRSIPASPERSVRVQIAPVGSVSLDSDYNRTMRAELSVSLSTPAGHSFGADVARLEVRDDLTSATGWEGALRAEWRPSRQLLMSFRGGVVKADVIGRESALEPTAQLRLRSRSKVSLDLRARREPIQATPQLFQSPVILTESRGTIELLVVSVVRVRGFGRYGRLSAPDEVNERSTWGGGPVVRLPAGVEVSSSFARTRYARPTEAGYFAPQRVDALDMGVYAEPSPWGPFSIALDLGGGAERVTRHPDGPASEQAPPHRQARDWQPALRFWMQGSLAVATAGEVRLDVEAYRTQVADAVASEASSWRSGAVGLSTSWRP